MSPRKGKLVIIFLSLVMLLIFDYSYLPVKAQFGFFPNRFGQSDQFGFFPNQFGISPFQSEAGILQGTGGAGELRVEKIISDLSNQNIDLDPSDFTFRIAFNNGTDPRFFRFPDSGVVRLSIDNGVGYSVTEPNRPRSDINVDLSIGCQGTSVGGEFERCRITNEITGVPTSEAGFIEDPLANLTSESGTIEGITPPAPGNVVQPAGDVTSESGTIVEPSRGNAPFKQCLAPSVVPTSQNNPGGTTAQLVVPSSATYTIAGKTHVSELLSSTQLDNSLVIKIYNDQKDNDGITFGTANPRLIGQIAVGSNEIDPVDLFKFEINDVDSTCDFVTLAEPISQDPDEAFSPLGNTSEVDPNDFKLKLGTTIPVNHIKNELLVYCIVGESGRTDQGIVSGACPGGTEGAAFNTKVINPPFRQCQNAFVTPATQPGGSNFDVYVIKGSIGDMSHEEMSDLISDDGSNHFSIQIVADNVLTNPDQIKIADSNNPFITIYFIINAGESDAEIIPFEISKVSTECTDVGFAATPQIN